MTNRNDNIQVGDMVRSFDFPTLNRSEVGEDACYVEGEVVEFRRIEGRTRYVIRATRRVFGGKEVEAEQRNFYPPVNGTPCAFGRSVTDGVEKIEAN